MILLWGTPGDAPMDAVCAALAALDAPHVLVDQRAARPPRLRLSGDVSGGRLRGELVEVSGAPRARLDLEEVRAFYLRPVDPVAQAFAPEAAAPLSPPVEIGLLALADFGPPCTINRPSAMAANNAKPHQLAQIAACGFDVPDTLVTTDPEAARAFWRRHGEVIYKSVSGTRSIVRRLDPKDEARLDAVASCPTQFQAHIPGVDLRVHVVGERLFCTEIRSSADDYRYATRTGDSVSHLHVELPTSVAAACVRMVRHMDLLLAGVDLRRTPDGSYVCFEVNPSPAFPYYDPDGEHGIAAAIAELLATASTDPARP